jgi:hypothetical protein
MSCGTDTGKRLLHGSYRDEPRNPSAGGRESAEQICGKRASGWRDLPSFDNRQAFFNVTDALIEIADGCAHHHQHPGAFAALLPDQVFDPFESRGLRDYAVLNFDQDLQYDVGRSFSHDENII